MCVWGGGGPDATGPVAVGMHGRCGGGASGSLDCMLPAPQTLILCGGGPPAGHSLRSPIAHPLPPLHLMPQGAPVLLPLLCAAPEGPERAKLPHVPGTHPELHHERVLSWRAAGHRGLDGLPKLQALGTSRAGAPPSSAPQASASQTLSHSSSAPACSCHPNMSRGSG